jgi:hypothetical protein
MSRPLVAALPGRESIIYLPMHQFYNTVTLGMRGSGEMMLNSQLSADICRDRSRELWLTVRGQLGWYSKSRDPALYGGDRTNFSCGR